jgi:hypothetical protein
MKKPGVRILLLVVLLGLAIFYFRYMREGFEECYDVVDDPYTLDVDETRICPETTPTPIPTISGIFKVGEKCLLNGKQSKTDKGKTLYCCAGTWKSSAC